MIKVEANNNTDHVEVTLHINGNGIDIAEEIEAIVTELYE